MKKIIEFIKFSFIGGIMTLLNFALFALLIELCNVNYIVSNILSYIIAVVLSYILNVLFTFKIHKKSKKQHLQSLLNYFVMKLVLLVCDSFCMYLFVSCIKLNVYLSKFVLTILFLFLSFPLSKIIIDNKVNHNSFKKTKEILKLLRVKHYLKNLLVFVPLFFGKMFFNLEFLKEGILAFIAFSLTSSIIYIINDIKDREKDKLHLVKRKRPIASGKISVKLAIIIAIFLAILVTIISFFGIKNRLSGLLLLLYLIINIGYSLGLKNIPLLDVTILVIGFIVRVFYGASVLQIKVSNWLYLTILSLSFYLSLGKRRNEIIKSGNKETRKVLKYYTKDFLDKNMYVCLTNAIVFYSLWCNDLNSISMFFSIPVVIIICMRYNMIVEGDSYGDPVDVILSDKCILCLGILYLLILIFGIYFPYKGVNNVL